MKIEIIIDDEKLQEESCELYDEDIDSRNLEYFVKSFLSDFEESYPQFKKCNFDVNPETGNLFSEIYKSYLDLTDYLQSLEFKRVKNAYANQQS